MRNLVEAFAKTRELSSVMKFKRTVRQKKKKTPQTFSYPKNEGCCICYIFAANYKPKRFYDIRN